MNIAHTQICFKNVCSVILILHSFTNVKHKYLKTWNSTMVLNHYRVPVSLLNQTQFLTTSHEAFQMKKHHYLSSSAYVCEYCLQNIIFKYRYDLHFEPHVVNGRSLVQNGQQYVLSFRFLNFTSKRQC